MAQASTSEDQGPSLEARLRALATELVERLGRVLESALGAPPAKPAELVDRLGLDKTLASKTLRGLRSDQPLLALLELPAPKGLGIATDAAEREGAAAPTVAAMRESIARLASLQHDFAGGRAGLLAVLSGWLPETRDKEDRHARQAAFRALSTITGTRIDALYNVYAYAPSPDDPETCDTALVVARLGIRRLRHGSSIRVASLIPDTSGHDVPVRTSLSGEPLGDSPRNLLLPAFCSDPLPDLDVLEMAGRVELILGAKSPPLDGSADLAFGSKARGLVPRYRTDDRAWDYTLTVGGRPAVVLVADILVHRDLFDGRPPIVTPQLGLSDPDMRGPQFEQADRVDQPMDVRALGTGLSRLGSNDVPRCQELLAHMFAELRWDPEQFRVYRIRVPYPVPGIALLIWFELPTRP
ncbi:MAG: hypothetical protein AAGI22_03110 [Planctomycetota bacterium]